MEGGLRFLEGRQLSPALATVAIAAASVLAVGPSLRSRQQTASSNNNENHSKKSLTAYSRYHDEEK